jgi:hypothetical protein
MSMREPTLLPMALDHRYKQNLILSYRCSGRVMLSCQQASIKRFKFSGGVDSSHRQLCRLFGAKGKLQEPTRRSPFTRIIMSDIPITDRDSSTGWDTTSKCPSEGTSSSISYPEMPASSSAETDARERSDGIGGRSQDSFGLLLFKGFGSALKQYQITACVE